MPVCQAIPPAAGFITSMTGYLDCQAQVLGWGAWQALAAPGSTLAVVLTGFLTITIALIGYNLLLGHSMSVRGGTLAFVKIGAVFALATSWPAYRTLVYDLVTDGPPQLVAEIGPQAGVIGSDGTLTQRLDGVDRALSQLAVLGAGPLPPDLKDSSGAYIAPPPFAGFDAFALGGSRILFDLTVVASLGIVRIITGLMLALGPFIIAFLMFDSTRSLFEGWVRVLAGAALAAVGTSIALGLELALLEPWVSGALARRMADEPMPTLPTELFVISCLFAMIVLAALYACMRVMRAFRFPLLLRLEPGTVERPRSDSRSTVAPRVTREAESEVQRTRAATVASILSSMSRRELQEAAAVAPSAAPTGRVPDVRIQSTERTFQQVPLGRTFSRRTTSRVSASAGKRDAGA
jgi:type IV secretion system protein VirB6